MEEYKPKFPAHLVKASEFHRSERLPNPIVDPRLPGAWLQAVELSLSFQRQWLRNESWYWECNEHAVMINGELYFWQPDYPAWIMAPGYELHQPLGDSGMMRTAGIE